MDLIFKIFTICVKTYLFFKRIVMAIGNVLFAILQFIVDNVLVPVMTCVAWGVDWLYENVYPYFAPFCEPVFKLVAIIYRYLAIKGWIFVICSVAKFCMLFGMDYCYAYFFYLFGILLFMFYTLFIVFCLYMGCKKGRKVFLALAVFSLFYLYFVIIIPVDSGYGLGAFPDLFK